jgi:hypothetical protein
LEVFLMEGSNGVSFAVPNYDGSSTRFTPELKVGVESCVAISAAV